MPFACRSALLAILVVTGLAAPVASRAAEVAPEQAQAVARQLRDWLGTLLGNNVAIPPDLLRATAADEQVRLDIPLPLPLLDLRDDANEPTDALISVKIRPLDATRWAIEDLRIPSRIALTPELAADISIHPPRQVFPQGKPGATSNGKTGRPPPTADLEILVRSQNARGIYDTSLQSESRLALAIQGIAIRGTGLGDIQQRTEASIDLYTGLYRLRPNPSGGIDSIADLTMEGYRSVSTDPLIGEMRVASDRVRLRGEINGLMTGQVTQLIQTTIQWGMEAALKPPSSKPDDKLGEAGRAKLKAILTALKNIVAGFTVRESVDGLNVQALGYEGALDRLEFGLEGGAPDGKLAAQADVSLEGLKIPALPVNYIPFVPRKISLRPTVGNIDLAAITALAEEAAAPKADLDAIRDKLKSLLAGNRVTFGMDPLRIQIGETKLTARGELIAIRPMVASGKAEITITGFDALMEMAQKLPEAKQAIPLLALVRGLARAEKEKLVWRLALTEDQKVTINGIDLRKLGAH